MKATKRNELSKNHGRRWVRRMKALLGRSALDRAMQRAGKRTT